MRTRFETEAQRNSEKAFCISEWNHLFSRVSRSHNWSGKNEKPGNDVEYEISMHYADFPAIFFRGTNLMQNTMCLCESAVNKLAIHLIPKWPPF